MLVASATLTRGVHHLQGDGTPRMDEPRQLNLTHRHREAPTHEGQPRRLVVVVLACLLAVFVISGLGQSPRPDSPGPASTRPVSLQVVAHQDDDLLFMNPDVAQGVRAGQPTVTVFLTAGESDVPDRAGYAAARQAGSRASYARMAGCQDEWRGEPLVLDADHQVEQYTLRCKPDVRLVFVNLPENNDPRVPGGRGALARLWNDPSDVQKVRSIVPRGAVVDREFGYQRSGVIELLVDLFAHFRPTVVRTQDADPDPRYPGWAPLHDHPDHVMAARFTGEALREYQASRERPQFVALNYRDYGISASAQNVAGAALADKQSVFGTYLGFDRLASGAGEYALWQSRMRYRWQRGTSWVARTQDGLLHAFAVRSGAVLAWDERPDGSWAGPAALPAAGPVAPQLAAAPDAAGRLWVFARRRDTAEIVAIGRLPGGGWPAGWAGLGNPNDQVSPALRAQAGAPAAALGGDGRVVVFVRNGAGGASALGQLTPGGEWQRGWTDIGGAGVADDLRPVTAGDGRIELFGAGPDRLLHWSQARPGGPFGFDPSLPSAPPAESPAAVRGADGRVAVYYPVAGSTSLAAQVQGPDGRWTAPVIGPDPGGVGPPSAAAGTEGVRLFRSGANGGIWTCGPVGQGSACPGWSDLGGTPVDGAVAGADGTGAVVLLAVGMDGRLLVDRQERTDAPFSGWRATGS
jgi:LmbE family N-acetylglucosaminyl deacetylase